MDIYEEAFIKQKKLLLQCQESKSLNSCYSCDQTFDCKVKQEYIKATYEKMNKGKTGGFDF